MKKWLGKSIALTALIAAFVLSMAVGTVCVAADQEGNAEQAQTMDNGQNQGAADEQGQPAEAPAQESGEGQAQEKPAE